jgi:hypothetical protein
VTYERYIPTFTDFYRHGLGSVIEEALNCFNASRNGAVRDREAMYDHLERVYLSAVCFHKHEGYAEEEEVRIALPETPFDEYVFERVGGYAESGRTSYLKLAAAGPESDAATYSTNNAPRLPIIRVRIGPRYATDIDAEIAEIEGLLLQHGYGDAPVDVSAIPYRG